jgi:putative ABC transport system ATP-binding protein
LELVSLVKLSKQYGKGTGLVKALNGVNLKIDKGEFTVFAGPSGSGKTTLLNMVGCLDRPSSGEVLVSGINIAAINARNQADFRREHVGFIFQSYNLVPVLTAFENVEFPLTLLKKGTKAERSEKVMRILAEVGLKGLEERRPGELSGGQQQRVAIARALVKEPTVILADEPTANLDSAAGHSIMDLMKKLNEQKGITFIFSSHDPMVINMAKRVVRIQDGQIEKDEKCG